MSGFYNPNTVVSMQYAQPTTGQTVTGDGSRVIFIDPAGTLATLTIALPASPVNGQMVSIATSQILTSLTITGTIIGTLTTLALGGFAQFVYNSNASKWFRFG